MIIRVRCVWASAHRVYPLLCAFDNARKIMASRVTFVLSSGVRSLYLVGYVVRKVEIEEELALQGAEEAINRS